MRSISTSPSRVVLLGAALSLFMMEDEAVQADDAGPPRRRATVPRSVQA